jgi:hypothetical protein
MMLVLVDRRRHRRQRRQKYLRRALGASAAHSRLSTWRRSDERRENARRHTSHVCDFATHRHRHQPQQQQQQQQPPPQKHSSMSLNVALVSRAALSRSNACQLGRNVVSMATADSTMLVAKRALGLLPADNAVPSVPSAAAANPSEGTANPRPNLHGAVFVADEQSAGVGRRGRSWQSGRGSRVCISRLFGRMATQSAFRTAIKLNFATPLAVVEALHAVGVAGARVKWPNDAWVDGRKICGMLGGQ